MVVIFSTRWDYKWKTEERKNTLFSDSKWPESMWAYSKWFFAWDLFFSSWQIWVNPETMELTEWWIEEETKQACRNISYLLTEYWLALKDVVKVNIYLKKISNYSMVDEIYKNYFIMKPARTIVEVSWLQKNASIEIEIIAFKSQK